MNTTLAFIFTIVVTNWSSIGMFTDKIGNKFDVQQGQIQTNTVVDVLWNEIEPKPSSYAPNRIMNRRFGSTNRFTLKSVDGPIVGEKRIHIPNYFFTNVFVTNPAYGSRIFLNAEDFK